jgi:hypothetical protein
VEPDPDVPRGSVELPNSQAPCALRHRAPLLPDRAHNTRRGPGAGAARPDRPGTDEQRDRRPRQLQGRPHTGAGRRTESVEEDHPGRLVHPERRGCAPRGDMHDYRTRAAEYCPAFACRQHRPRCRGRRRRPLCPGRPCPTGGCRQCDSTRREPCTQPGPPDRRHARGTAGGGRAVPQPISPSAGSTGRPALARPPPGTAS